MQLCLRACREPQPDGLRRLPVAADFFNLADCVVEQSLQLLELGKPPRDVRFDPSAPAAPEPELYAAKLERIWGQLTQGDPNRAAAPVAPAKERPWGEIVGV